MSKAEGVLNAIVERLRINLDVQAAWLAGSRGRGTADEFSDLDIWVALDDPAMPPVVDDPLAFVHTVVPTVMHILAPSIAPSGGAFIGTWVPVEDEFEQVDWYITPLSSARRDSETMLIFGEVPEREPVEALDVPGEYSLAKAADNLRLALLMIGNMVKHARRGSFWRTADHARHVDKCLGNARSFLSVGAEPCFVEAQHSLLPEPPPTTVREVQHLALLLLDEAERLSLEVKSDLDSAITAMRAQVTNWIQTDWKPTEEYYRSLPRRYLGAGMLFTDADNNILLVETTYKKQFEIPGGVVEAGESPRAAAQREVMEELGLRIQPGHLLVCDSRSQPSPKGDAIMLVYDGGGVDDPSAIHADGREIARIHFVPLHKLDQHCTPQMAARLKVAIRARELRRTIEIHDGEVIF